MIGIYKITNKITNRVYIGQSLRCKTRWSQHKWSLKNKLHSNQYLQNSFNKYGIDIFSFDIIEECTNDILDIKEQCWKDYYISIGKIYNFGECVKSPMLGIPRSFETKEKIKISNTGKKHSIETKQKMSLSSMGKKKTLSHCENIKKTKSKYFKKIERIDINTGEVKEYESISEASRDGFSRSKINLCCTNRRKKHANYYWKYWEVQYVSE